MNTLFLDFDGVLHPFEATRAQLFCQVPNFERVMRQFPDWQIVVSSDWRHYETLAQLRGHFSSDIAQRIVGITPSFLKMPEIRSPIREFRRECECRQWLHTNGCRAQPWLAVDDWPWQFQPNSSHLLVVDTTTGLDDEHADQLVERLRRF